MKRYSVFVSSTYKDLIEERKEVIQALLELDCIPIGMELFSANDDDQWTIIKNLIDDADYYILIIAGKYGSIGMDGKSYTQMEYEYALSVGTPIISFIYKNYSELQAKNIETNPVILEKLNDFKSQVQQKMVKYWESPKELGSVVSRSLINIIKTKPRQGWVKADSISSDEANMTILSLKEENNLLKAQIESFNNINEKDLSSGEDKYSFSYHYQKKGSKGFQKDAIELSWNELFTRPFAILIKESPQKSLYETVNSYFLYLLTQKDPNYIYVNVIQDVFNQMLIQFLALNLIAENVKKRQVSDKEIYWKLTEKGIKKLTHLRAIRK